MSRWNGINGITSHVAYLNDGSVVSVRWRSSFDSQSTMKHTPSGPMYTPPARDLAVALHRTEELECVVGGLEEVGRGLRSAVDLPGDEEEHAGTLFRRDLP